MNAEFREVLEERTAQYAVEVFKYLRELPYDVSIKVIAHQLGKSASSIGANYHEANRSESRDDFVHKVAIAVKEANESCYWFKMTPPLLTPPLTHFYIGVCGVVGGMMVIELLAGKMRLDRGRWVG